jgi:FSR family fosmidomycin resistance protein-like MFS transporter
MSDNQVDINTREQEKSTDTPKARSFFLTSLPYFILAHATHHILTALPQPMLPYMKKEFNLNYTETAAITSAFSISGGLSQLPSGFLADKIGPTILITMGILGVAIGGLFIGLSTNYYMLLAALVFMGLMSGGYHPASTPLISMSVPVHQRGRALGAHLLGGNFSFFIAPLIAAFIAGLLNWRGVYITLSIPTGIIGILFYMYLNKRYGKAHIEAMKRKQSEERPPQPGHKRRLWAFLVMMVLGCGAAASVHPFLSVYMVDVLGASNEVAAASMSIISFFGICGPIGGYMSDKIGSAKVMIITDILSGLMIFVLKEVGYGWGLWIVLGVIGLIHALRFPVAEAFIISQTEAKYRSTVYGVYYTTMQYTGAIFAPIMGYFIQNHGFHAMFTFSAMP